MTCEIYIVSGFLGAGKTTLVQKLLKEAFQNEKVVLIENDFGDISVDAALLKAGGVEVKQITSGCICCSLSGDFTMALKELLHSFNPDKIIIEPSGVGKLSDITSACMDPSINRFAKLKTKITVADVKRCKMYLDNFGEFYEDQIQEADIVVLSRTEQFPNNIEESCKLIRELNIDSPIVSKPWNKVHGKEIIYAKMKNPKHQTDEHDVIYTNRHNNEDHIHDDTCGCSINNSADDVFDTVTIRTSRRFTAKDLRKRLIYMEQNAQGTILRAKGIVLGRFGYINLQYIPNDIRLSKCTARGNAVCIIGHNLNRQELVNIFQ